MIADTGVMVGALRIAGLDAEEDWGPRPSVISINTDAGEILIAVEFNREDDGWEAQIERTPGTAEGLEDGPDLHAPMSDVLLWILKIVRNPETY